MTPFQKDNCEKWTAAIKSAFGSNPPPSQSWEELNEMVRVLGPFCKENLNHMFYPTGGGNDVDGVTLSWEEGCLELIVSRHPELVRPRRLTFEYFSSQPCMSYFRLETHTLEPSGVYESDEDSNDEPDHKPNERRSEEVVELDRSRYIDRSAWDQGSIGQDEAGNDIPLPKSARLVVRIFSGSIVLFAKGSLYNELPGQYDAYNAQHDKKTAVEFRRFVQEIVDYIDSRKTPAE